MKTNLESYKNASILQITNNKAAKYILTYCSRNPEIQSIVFNIVMKTRLFGISLAAVWMSKEEEEMKLVNAGSQGPWFQVQEYSPEDSVMRVLMAN